MPTVETALGPVSTADLGATLMHEHIVTRSPGVQENWPHLWDRPAILQIAERKMADLHARGIRAIVDLTTVDLGLVVVVVDAGPHQRLESPRGQIEPRRRGLGVADVDAHGP